VQFCRYFLSQFGEFCSCNPLCCFSTSVVILVYLVIDSVRKLSDTPSCNISVHVCARVTIPCRSLYVWQRALCI